MDKKCSSNSLKPKAGKKDPSLLKNIRQIGMPTLGYKLYIEDSVLSFLKHQMKKEDSRVIALVGSETETEDAACIFVEGAIKAEDISVCGKDLSFGKKAFTNLYTTMNTYFDDCSLIGWYVPMYEMIRTYGTTLGEKCKLFVLDDPTGQGEIFYIKDINRIKKLNGYNVYYERNDSMKKYMLSCKESTDTAYEYEERKIEEPEGKPEPLKTKKTEDVKEDTGTGFKFAPFLYAASSVLAIIILVAGITMLDNYEKMQEMQSSIDTLTDNVNSSNQDENPDTTETDEPTVTEESGEDSENVLGDGENTQEVHSDNIDTVEYYVVKEGDTLADISIKLYGSVNLVDEICEINSIENEDSLYIGQKIYLPQEEQ